MSVSVIERTKIQAEVLVPLIKALQAELGIVRANTLVRNTLGDLYRRQGEEFAKRRGATDLGETMASAFSSYARDEALQYEMVEQSQDSFAIDVRACRYAEYFKALNEPEIGFLLVCTADFPVAEGIDANIQLTRTQTIMQGATHCDFRYQRSRYAAVAE